MKKVILLLAGATLMASCSDKGAKPKTLVDSVSYAIGVSMSKNLNNPEAFTDSLDIDMLVAGLKAAIDSNAAFNDTIAMEVMNKYFTQRQEKNNQKLIKEHDEFIKKNSDAGMKMSESGLLYKVVKEGAGIKPDQNDKIVGNISFKDKDGEELFSITPKDTLSLQELGIPGVIEGMQMMSIGSNYQFVLPHHLAFGPKPQAPKVKPYAPIVLSVELLDVKPVK
jgi:FKBP-type peptidyl-prolyl cis-trans isomerase